jgi:hypothetical protein
MFEDAATGSDHVSSSARMSSEQWIGSDRGGSSRGLIAVPAFAAGPVSGRFYCEEGVPTSWWYLCHADSDRVL